MTFLWLIVWLLNDTPALRTSPEWNNWMIALVVCIALDLLSSGGILSRD